VTCRHDDLDGPAGRDVVGFGSARRPRRPWVTRLLLAASLVVAGAVVAARAVHPGPRKHTAPPTVTVTYARPRLLGVTAGWELFARGQNFVVAIRMASGQVTRTDVPPLESASPEVAFLIGPHQVIVRSFDEVPSYEIPDGRPARQLTGMLAGSTFGPLLPGPLPGTAWIRGGQDDRAFDLVALNGQLTGTYLQLPVAGSLPATAVADGRGYVLLLDNGNEVYDAGPGWDRLVTSRLIAVGPARWLAVACRRQACRNVVINPASGAVVPLPGPALPNSVAFEWPSLGVTAPDGSAAAVPVFGSDGDAAVRLVNLRSGASRLTAARMSVYPDSQTMAWSPDSRWLFIVAAGGRLLAVNARTGRTADLGVTLPPVSQVAVRAAPGPAPAS
jgi:hypothetical protein